MGFERRRDLAVYTAELLYYRRIDEVESTVQVDSMSIYTVRPRGIGNRLRGLFRVNEAERVLV